MAVKSPVVSTLNPNAPLFVPAAFVATEDFSAEWWRLVETSPAFRDYWLAERFVSVEEPDLGADHGEAEDDMDELEAAAEEFMIEQVEKFLEQDDNSDDSDNKENQELMSRGMKALDLNAAKEPPPELSEHS